MTTETETTVSTTPGETHPERVQLELSRWALAAIRVALVESAREIESAAHDFAPVHDFRAALRELPEL